MSAFRRVHASLHACHILPMHLCLIDDDSHLLATLIKGLSELGHECEAFQSSTDGLARLLDGSRLQPDILLLDVMMPEIDGWTLLARMRESGLRTPVIYLTARRDVDDRVRGLVSSADDYVMKPFALKELLARCQAVLRRHGYREPFEVKGLTVHRSRERVEIWNRKIEVSAREHAFLKLLCSEPGRVFSRPELLRELWEIDFDPHTNVVEVLVARLRRKLGPEAGHLVETVVREGYRIHTDVSK